MCANILPYPTCKRNIHYCPEGNTQPLHYDNITLNCYITWWCFQRIFILLCETLHQAILNDTTLLFNSAPNCTILCFTVVYYAVAYYTILHYTILLYTAVYYDMMYCTVLYCTTLQRTKLDLALHTDVYFLHCHLLEGCNKNRTPLFHIDYFFFSTTHLDLPSRNPHFHYIKGCYLFSLLLWLKLHVGMRLIKVSIFQGKPSAVRFLLQS